MSPFLYLLYIFLFKVLIFPTCNSYKCYGVTDEERKEPIAEAMVSIICSLCIPMNLYRQDDTNYQGLNIRHICVMPRLLVASEYISFVS